MDMLRSVIQNLSFLRGKYFPVRFSVLFLIPVFLGAQTTGTVRRIIIDGTHGQPIPPAIPSNFLSSLNCGI
jgi:hypothetical protein